MKTVNISNADKDTLSTKSMVLCGFMAALLCILSPISIPLGFTPVPLTLGIFIVFLTAYILPPQTAALSVLIYLLLGMAGLPVFSGFRGGIDKLIGPTGGYLIGYIFTVFISSFVIHRYRKIPALHFAGMFFSLFICYLFGTYWFSIQQKMSFGDSLKLCVFPFIVGDIIKIILAFFIGQAVFKRIKNNSGF